MRNAKIRKKKRSIIYGFWIITLFSKCSQKKKTSIRCNCYLSLAFVLDRAFCEAALLFSSETGGEKLDWFAPCDNATDYINLVHTSS